MDVILLVVVALVILIGGQIVWGQILKIWEILVGKPDAAMVFFTMVLVVVTIAYVYVTVRLLKHSRDVLLADMIFRMAECYMKDTRKNIEQAMKGGEKEEIERFGRLYNANLESFRAGYLTAFRKIDKRLGKEFEELGVVWAVGAMKVWAEEMRKEKKDKDNDNDRT